MCYQRYCRSSFFKRHYHSCAVKTPMGITEWIIEEITAVIDVTGYAGVVLFMMLESMIAPVPSEAVMPFAGFLISEGRMSWVGVVVASTIGSMVGSTLSYVIG